MTGTATSTPATPEAPKGLLSRIVGVFFSPRATFAEVATRPRVLGVFTIGLLVVIAGLFLFFSTEVGQRAWIDQQVQGAESFGRTMSDQQIQGMERIAPYMGYIVAVLYLIFIPIVVAILSGILKDQDEDLREVMALYNFTVFEEITQGEWLVLVVEKHGG